MMTKDREYRAFEFETNEDEMIVEGKAIAFEQRTKLYSFEGIDFFEVIDRSALDGAEMQDVVFVINHEGTPAARTRNRTLALTKTDDGLYVRADLSKSSIGPGLHKDIKNGLIDRMSFSFTIREHEYDKATHTTRIKKIGRLFDVSAVNFPAYEQTEISARDFFKAEAERELMEVRTRQALIEELKRKAGV